MEVVEAASAAEGVVAEDEVTAATTSKMSGLIIAMTINHTQTFLRSKFEKMGQSGCNYFCHYRDDDMNSKRSVHELGTSGTNPDEAKGDE